SGVSLTENFALLVPGLAQLQIVQETTHDFLFRIVRGPDFGPASLERLHALAAERFGEGVRCRCEYVERIPQEPSGKYRFCISRVAHPFPGPRGEGAPRPPPSASSSPRTTTAATWAAPSTRPWARPSATSSCWSSTTPPTTRRRTWWRATCTTPACATAAPAG